MSCIGEGEAGKMQVNMMLIRRWRSGVGARQDSGRLGWPQSLHAGAGCAARCTAQRACEAGQCTMQGWHAPSGAHLVPGDATCGQHGEAGAGVVQDAGQRIRVGGARRNG